MNGLSCSEESMTIIMFCRFDTIPACDRRTDGRTDVQPIAIACISMADARKTRQDVSLVYCTNQTKRLMEKKKKKTIEQLMLLLSSPVSVRKLKGSPCNARDGVLWREGFKEKVSFKFRVAKSRSDGQ